MQHAACRCTKMRPRLSKLHGISLRRGLHTVSSSAKVCRSSRARDKRHTFGTLHVGAGTPLKVVSDLMGHATSQQTANTYMHGDVAVTADWMQRFEQSLAPTGEGALAAAVN